MKKLLFILPFILYHYAQAQSKNDNNKWNIEKLSGNVKKASFSVNEGTWINLDVSPNGKEIVFDLLGDIYKISVNGGKAKLLSDGPAYETQPRYSPNGKFISYTSDKSGTNNIWIMSSDGSNKKAITKEEYNSLNNAGWTPDNQFLVVQKETKEASTSKSSEVCMYHISGGEGVQLTKSSANFRHSLEPQPSSDGKFIYFTETNTQHQSTFNLNPNAELFTIKKINRESGEVEAVAGGLGGAVRAQPSPDGKLLAYVKRIRLKSVLFIQDLRTGEEWPLYDDLSRDQQESHALATGMYPNFAWTPDNKSIIVFAKGKIKQVELSSQQVKDIDFEVNASQSLADNLIYENTLSALKFPSQAIRQLSTSPDGKTVAFSAAGHIYIKTLSEGEPKRISTGTDFEYDPSFSPDGKYLAYVSWNDERKASINKFELATGKTEALTAEKGIYHAPRFSSRGDRVVFHKSEGDLSTGYLFTKNPGVYIVAATGGKVTQVSNKGFLPVFNYNDTKLYYQVTDSSHLEFRSMDINGTSPRVHYIAGRDAQFTLSPDGSWLAFTEGSALYVTPFVNTADAVQLSAENKLLPLNKISSSAGSYLHWNTESNKLHWVSGNNYFSKAVISPLYLPGEKEPTTGSDSSKLAIKLPLQAYSPQGKIAFKNARLITMKGNEVIENGALTIENNRITAVGPSSSLTIPEDAKVIDAEGLTIMPGLIDVSTSLPIPRTGIIPQKEWSLYANLAYGVTTLQITSNSHARILAEAEMIRTGTLTGPRILPAGIVSTPLTQFPAIAPAEINAARSRLGLLKEQGYSYVMFTNILSRRDQQLYSQAAREFQINTIMSSGSSIANSITAVSDGYGTLSRNIPVVPLYNDIKALWSNAKTFYTPGLIASYGSLPGENFWYDRTNVWEKERLLNYIPRPLIDLRSRRRITAEFGDYGHIEAARAARQLSAAGTRLTIGSNGRLQGLGTHWEMWMLYQGGMNPQQILQCATINGAQQLGLSKEIGSLEPGKIADIVVTTANPLDDIRNSEKIKYVITNGRLFDVQTMNEEGNDEQMRGNFWWQTSRGDAFGSIRNIEAESLPDRDY